MPRPAPRFLSVVDAFNLTPNMRRVVLSGDDLRDFPADPETANFKLILPAPGQTKINLGAFHPRFGSKGPNSPVVRTYTIRQFDRSNQHIYVDFAIHKEHGPASRWATEVSPGDVVGFAGPGQPKWARFEADWFLFAGDMSALPAIAANIEALPENATGYAVIEVMSEGDIQPLKAPQGIEFIWLINPHPEEGNSKLAETVTSLPWLAGSPSIWVAGEGSSVQKIRRFMVDEKHQSRREMYISGYWQIGLTEDAHQIEKRKEH